MGVVRPLLRTLEVIGVGSRSGVVVFGVRCTCLLYLVPTALFFTGRGSRVLLVRLVGGRPQGVGRNLNRF